LAANVRSDISARKNVKSNVRGRSMQKPRKAKNPAKNYRQTRADKMRNNLTHCTLNALNRMRAHDALAGL
jgi:hypothetical protein